MRKLKFLIADDHKLVRDGIKYTLTSQYKDIVNKVDEATNGSEAVSLARSRKYDIILMDINMPETNGIEATKKITSNNKKAKVIALSMYNESYEIKNMVKAGAKGYLLKNTGPDELRTAIETIVDGGRYFSNEVAVRLIESYEESTPSTTSLNARKEALTKREKQILKHIAQGLTNEEIAEKYFLSKRTVDAHRQNIINKLQVKNTAALIRYALEHPLD